MSDDKTFDRNELGDMQFPKPPSDYMTKLREKQWTHVFHFKGLHDRFIPLNTRGISKKMETINVEIFKSPTHPPWDEWIKLKGQYESYLITYFRPVFPNRSTHSELAIDKSKIIWTKDQHRAFKKFIEENNLVNHEDFILFLIAKIEETFINDVEYNERPEQRERIRKFPQEVENLIEALRVTDSGFIMGHSNNEKPPPRLDQIIFQFNRRPSIKVADDLLTSSVTDATREYFKNQSMNDWEKQLKAFPSVFDGNRYPKEFRYRICHALHNFFKGVGAFKFGNNETTNEEMYVIARMLDFANVKFFNSHSKAYDLTTDKGDIIKVVRNHVKRKELVYTPTHYSSSQIKPDFEKLIKYFGEPFIRAGGSLYSESDIQEVFHTTDRFKFNHLFPHLLHIFKCLRQYFTFIGHQLQANFNKEIESNKDYNSLKAITTHLKEGGIIQSLQFKLDGKSDEFGFSEKATLEIVKQALLEFQRNHQPEFEVDLYETKLDINTDGQTFKLSPTGKLNEPQNRFLPDFVRRCYEFLLKEAPPGPYDSMPSEKYYGVIAMLLVKSWYFGHQNWDEKQIIAQVKYWHSLGK